jgi:hypothetical protein
MVVKMRFKACDCEVFGDFSDSTAHAIWGRNYASEGGTCFLKLICDELGASKLGYIVLRLYLY